MRGLPPVQVALLLLGRETVGDLLLAPAVLWPAKAVVQGGQPDMSLLDLRGFSHHTLEQFRGPVVPGAGAFDERQLDSGGDIGGADGERVDESFTGLGKSRTTRVMSPG